MARLRQLPQLYLRGAIVNETMRHLTPEQRQEADTLTRKIANSTALAGHRQEFITRLGQTIGGDYRDSRIAADNEFLIAVWRAIIYLRFHGDYSFYCGACKQDSYLTQRGKPKAFDRRYPYCPNCSKVLITKSGTTKLKAGHYADYSTVQDLCQSAKKAPEYSSPIKPVRGADKVKNWRAILDDPDQVSKFVGGFVWNYFRQHLRENEIEHHCKDPVAVAGPADQIAVEEVVSTLARAKYPHIYHPNANPHNNEYVVVAALSLADPALIEKLLVLKLHYKGLGVLIDVLDDQVVIHEGKGILPSVEAIVVKPQAVSLLSGSSRIESEDGEVSVLDFHYHNIIGNKPMQEDGIAELEATDLLDTIKQSLPDGAKGVLEIITQTGEAWRNYNLSTKTYVPDDEPQQDRPPREAVMAKSLRVSQRQIKQWLQDIKVQCLAHGLTPK